MRQHEITRNDGEGGKRKSQKENIKSVCESFLFTPSEKKS